MDEHSDLAFETYGPEAIAEGGTAPDERVRGFGDAVTRAFLEGRQGDERHRLVVEHLRADAVVVRGAWLAEPGIGTGAIPVATYSSFDKTLNVGGGRRLPLRMITDVTVSPAHRRRGLTRRLITEDLADAARSGVPLAALTASEGSIYGRFGFGPATWMRRVEVDTTARFAWRTDVDGDLADDPGRVEVVEPLEAWPAFAEVFAAHHEQVRGSVARPQFYEPISTGVLDPQKGGPDPMLRAAVHLDAGGRPDGCVLYRPVGEVDGVQSVDVVDLLALDDTIYLRLWRFLARIDLVGRVRWGQAPVLDVDPLPWALVEPRAVRTVVVRDRLWVRVLDVATALAARPWGADGEVVLGVDDPLGHAHGGWRVSVRDGVAEVSASDARPDVDLAAETLGSLYLGGVPVATLAAAGRLHGDPADLVRLAAMADGGPAPYCATAF